MKEWADREGSAEQRKETGMTTETKPSAAPFGIHAWIWAAWFVYAFLGLSSGEYWATVLMALWMIFVICGGLQKWIKK